MVATATFVAALAVPAVFDDNGVLFGSAFLVVCAMHLALYALARSSKDAKLEHLELSVQALDRWASRKLDWLTASA